MAKVAFILLALFSFAQDFDKACMQCHKKLQIDLKKIYFDYLLEYSSKQATIKAMQNYLLHPTPTKQIYKKAEPFKHPFSAQRLKKLLQIYWDRYTVIGKIQ